MSESATKECRRNSEEMFVSLFIFFVKRAVHISAEVP